MVSDRNGKYFAAWAKDSIQIRNAANWSQMSEIPTSGTYISAIGISPATDTLAAGNDNGRIDLWNLATGKNVATLSGHSKPVQCLMFTDDEEHLISGSIDGTLRLWDVPSRKQVAIVDGESVGKGYAFMAVAIAPNRTTFAAAYGMKIVIGELPNLALKRQLPSASQTGITSLAFSPDGKTLASCSLGSYKLWDAEMGGRRVTIRNKSNFEGAYIAFSKDGKHLCAWDGNNVQVFPADADFRPPSYEE
jgi:WD40 repeat protein